MFRPLGEEVNTLSLVAPVNCAVLAGYSSLIKWHISFAVVLEPKPLWNVLCAAKLPSA